MADESRIDSLIDVASVIGRELDPTISKVEQLVLTMQKARELRIEVATGNKSTQELLQLSKQLDVVIKQTKQAGLEALNEAKARQANARAVQQEEKATQQIIKTKQAETKATESGTRAKANDQKLLDQAIDDYYQLSRAYNEAALKAKNYVLRLGENHPIAVQAVEDANAIGNTLKKVDASVGQFGRNVGNYKSAFDGLGFSFTQVARELPSLSISVQQFALAISNNLPIVADELQKARAEITALKQAGQETPSLFQRITKSIFSWQVALSVVITLVTVFAGKLFGAKKAGEEFDKELYDLSVSGKKLEEQLKDLNSQIDFLQRLGDINLKINFGDTFQADILSLNARMNDLREQSLKLNDNLQKTKSIGKDLFSRFSDDIIAAISPYNKLADVPTEVVDQLSKADKKMFELAKENESRFKSINDQILENTRAQTLLARQNAERRVEEERKANLSIYDARLKLILDEEKAAFELYKFKQQLLIKEQNDLITYTSGKQREDAIKRREALEINLISKTTQFNLMRGQTELAFNKMLLRDKIINEEQYNDRVRSIDLVTASERKLLLLQETTDIKNEQIRRISDLYNFASEEKKLREEQIQADIKAIKELEDERIKLAIEGAAKAAQTEINEREKITNSLLIAENDRYKKQLDAAKGNQKAIEDAQLQHQIRVSQIIYDATINDIQAQITAQKKIIAIIDVPEDIKAEALLKISELEKKLSDLSVQRVEEANKKKEKSDKDYFDKLAEGFQKALGYYDQLTSIISGAFNAAAINQKNNIQDQINLIDKQKAADIDRINATVTDRKEAAAEIEIIDKRAQQRKEQLQQRQKEIDVKKAQFDKQAAIARIAIETALAVIRALGDNTVPYPVRVGYAIAAGALGAAQLAVAIATPIPRYAEGTDDHPGGLAITGDAGRHEAIELPDGSIMKSPNKATVMDLPAGTKVYPDYDKMIANATMTGKPVFVVNNDTGNTDKAVYKIGNDIVRAIKGQPQHSYQTEERWRKMTRTGHSFRKYLDINL